MEMSSNLLKIMQKKDKRTYKHIFNSNKKLIIWIDFVQNQ